MSTAVRASGLDVGYAGRSVVTGIELDVPRGAWLALVGTNGSGKSTLLRTLVGLLEPIGGEVDVLGQRPGHAARRIAYLGQHHPASSLLPLRVLDVVRMGRFPVRGLLGRFRAEDHRLVAVSMERLGVERLAHQPLRSLSGGQRQRVHLAQALARCADLLVLDEPTAGLDAAGREAYLDLVAAERARGATVIVATHDIAEAGRADQVLLLAHRVVAYGRPHEVLSAENLLDTFGVSIRGVDGGLLITETDHTHNVD